MKICCIYTITNTLNNKMYVGYSTDFEERSKSHISCLKNEFHVNEHLQNAVNKYGLENFKVEILEECEERFLCSQEHYWATILGVHNRKYGYNAYPTNPERKNYLTSEETKRKLRESLKGRKMSEEFKKKISKLHKGRKQSKEQIEKRACKRRGMKYPKEWGTNMSNNRNKKPFTQYTLDGKPVRNWDNMEHLTNTMKINSSGIYKNLNGESMSSHHYIWKYNEGIIPEILEQVEIKLINKLLK